MNYTEGAVIERGSFSLTADLFRIAVSDRIVLTGFFKALSAEQALTTNTQGVDRLSGFVSRYSLRTATARVHPAEASLTFVGKQITSKPVGGRQARLPSFSIWQ